MANKPCRCEACKERRLDAFMGRFAHGFKAVSLAVVATASLIFWAIGLGTTVDLMFDATPVVCKKGGQHGAE